MKKFLAVLFGLLLLPSMSMGQEQRQNDSWIKGMAFESGHCVFSTVSEKAGFGNLHTPVIDMVVIGSAIFDAGKTLVTVRVFNPTTLYIKSFNLTMAYHEDYKLDSAIESMRKDMHAGNIKAVNEYYEVLPAWWVKAKKTTKTYDTLLKPGDQTFLTFEVKNIYYPEKYPKHVGISIMPVVGFDYMPIFDK